MLIQDNQKPFENPPAGQYIGLLADVVDLGLVKTAYGEKAQIRMIWLLFGTDAQGQLVTYNDKENRQFRVMRQASQTMNPKSKLFETVSDVLNGEQPAVPFESENLIGRANLLFVKIEKAQNGKEYANVKAILPLPANTPVPAIPKEFVRNKDKKQQTNNAAPAGVQTVGVAQVAPATLPPTAAVAQAPAPSAAPVGIGPAPVVAVVQAPAIDLNATAAIPAAEQL